MQEQIEKRLRENFDPCDLKVVNESGLHLGHAGDDGSGESHFALSIVSNEFTGRSRVECQRMIYAALRDEMQIIHALSIKQASSEWYRVIVVMVFAFVRKVYYDVSVLNDT